MTEANASDLDVRQVAQYLQLQESTIYAWAQQGKIPATKVGRVWRFSQTELEAWLEGHLNGRIKA